MPKIETNATRENATPNAPNATPHETPATLAPVEPAPVAIVALDENAPAILRVRGAARMANSRVKPWAQQVTNAAEVIAEVTFGAGKVANLTGVPGEVRALLAERADAAIGACALLLAALALIPEDARPDPIVVGACVTLKQAKRATWHAKPWKREDLIVVARIGEMARIWSAKGADEVPAKHLEPAGLTDAETSALRASAALAGVVVK